MSTPEHIDERAENREYGHMATVVGGCPAGARMSR